MFVQRCDMRQYLFLFDNNNHLFAHGYMICYMKLHNFKKSDLILIYTQLSSFKFLFLFDNNNNHLFAHGNMISSIPIL